MEGWNVSPVVKLRMTKGVIGDLKFWKAINLITDHYLLIPIISICFAAMIFH
jgi:hypothetical protein